jgi:quercetin dioxygenase-like cupin family protein
MTKFKARFGRWIGLSYVFLMALVSGVWIMHAQQEQNPNFTGKITRIEDDSKPGIAHIHFEAGSRTKWHIHSGGQIILVEEGVGRTQLKGGPVLELKAGETTYAPAGVAHWHGASPDQAGTQFNVSRGTAQWLDAVTEKEYTTAPKKP